jgi:hypothetical protein
MPVDAPRDVRRRRRRRRGSGAPTSSAFCACAAVRHVTCHVDTSDTISGKCCHVICLRTLKSALLRRDDEVLRRLHLIIAHPPLVALRLLLCLHLILLHCIRRSMGARR